MPGAVQEAMERFLVESEKLAETFSRTLEEKKELSVNLLLQLEHKINEMNRLLERAEKGLAEAKSPPVRITETERANPAAPENRALVIRLAEQGLGVEEIARRSKLHRGEVELILDLERQFKK